MIKNNNLVDLPIEIIENIAFYLDICTLWQLLDTCQYCRYSLLKAKKLWHRIVFTFNDNDQTLHLLYATLRRFRDSNGHGIRQLVEEVIMDGTDDSMISPIVMIVKFPNLKFLSAKHRRFNTNLNADTKVLQEFLRQGTLKEKSLSLQHFNIYHYFMDNEPYLDAFQKTINRLSRYDHVQLDIRRCSESTNNSSILEQQLSQLNLYINGNNSAQTNDSRRDYNGCTKIISNSSRCWKCDNLFTRCWNCQPFCLKCKIKRLPAIANDHQRLKAQLDNRSLLIKKQQLKIEDDLKEEFSLFE